MPEEKGKNWFRKHPAWTVIIGVFIVLFIIGLFVQKSSNNTTGNTISNNTNSVNTTDSYSTPNSNQNTKDNSSEYTNESLIQDLLSYSGYNVINVSQGYDSTLGNYAIVEMYSYGSSISDIAMQIGSGYGALYGIWNDKDYYIVSLNNYKELCGFGIDGQEMRRFMKNETSDYELYNSITPECQNISR